MKRLVVAAKLNAKVYRCEECGVRYTLAGAERAQRDGCAAGCSGIEIVPAAEARGAA